jgi:hypothetical protein
MWMGAVDGFAILCGADFTGGETGVATTGGT